MMPSTVVDFREFEQIDVEDSQRRKGSYEYESKDVATWGDPPRITTRVVISIQPGSRESLLPILKDGIATNRLTLKAISKADGKSETITLSGDELAAIGEMLQVYEKAAALVREGVIKKDPLVSQKFGVASTPGIPQAMTVGSAVDDAELERFRSLRG